MGLNPIIHLFFLRSIENPKMNPPLAAPGIEWNGNEVRKVGSPVVLLGVRRAHLPPRSATSLTDSHWPPSCPAPPPRKWTVSSSAMGRGWVLLACLPPLNSHTVQGPPNPPPFGPQDSSPQPRLGSADGGAIMDRQWGLGELLLSTVGSWAGGAGCARIPGSVWKRGVRDGAPPVQCQVS